MIIDVDKEIQLQLFDASKAQWFFESIHKTSDFADIYRSRIQKRLNTIESVKDCLLDAHDNKFLFDGTPDFFIVWKGQLAGVFEFAPLESDTDYVEVGYWLFSEFRKKGIMTRTMNKMLDFAHRFRRPNVRATTPVENEASRRLLLTTGFIDTGVCQDFEKSHGEVETDAIYNFSLDF